MSFTGQINETRMRKRFLPADAAGKVSLTHICFLVCLILIAIPVLMVDTPPIFDYPNHLARAHVIAEYGKSDIFPSHFEITSFIIPNVLADLVVLAFMKIVGVTAAGKGLLILTFTLTLSGACALNRALTGQIAIWPLFTAALLYNEMFFWGMLNYDLGLAVLLWGLAAWFFLEGRSRGLQIAVGAAFAMLIFFAHLVTFGLYGVAIAATELRRLWLRWPGLQAALARLSLSASQFLPPLALFYAISPSSSLDSSARFDFSVFSKIMPFARFLSSGNPALDIATMAAIGGFLAAALLMRRIACHGGMALAAVLYLLLVATLPYSLMGSYFLDSRIIVAVALIFVAGLRPRAGRRGWAGLAAVVLIAIVGTRSLVLIDDWRIQERDYAKLLSVLDQVPVGSVIITAVGHPFEIGDWLASRHIKPSHEHSTLYVTIRRDALVPNIFARRGQNPLVFSSALEELNVVAHNPVSRLFNEDDARRLAAQAGAIADKRTMVYPPIPAVYVIAYHVPCARWPDGLPIDLAYCEDGFSLVRVHGTAEPSPDQATVPLDEAAP